MKIFLAIIWLILAGCSLCNNSWGDLPPLPSYTPTPNSEEGIELQRQIDEAEAYAASLRPSPRVLMEDGLILSFTKTNLIWFVESPYYLVQWRSTLDAEWKTIGTRKGNTYTGKLMEEDSGFYRILPSKEPTLPPTYPPKRFPTNAPPVMVSTNAPTGTNTVYDSRFGGFRKR